MSKVLQKLRGDDIAHDIIGRAHRRDARWGSGDTRDFALFVVDETRKEEDRRRDPNGFTPPRRRGKR